MALLGDLVKAVKDAIKETFFELQWPHQTVQQELDKLQDLWNRGLEAYLQTEVGRQDLRFINKVRGHATLAKKAYTEPGEFTQDLFDSWDKILRDALADLNVESTLTEAEAADVGRETLAARLEAGRGEAQNRVTAAITAINAIIVLGNTLSIAAEAASAGSVRSISDAIQSWVWANGLGSFSPLAFQPQVNASIQPLLQRWYNSRAVAQIPPVSDVIRFQLREVFLEGRRDELVGQEDRPIFNELMAQWGFDKFHADSYWGAHWQLPSIGQLNEMLFRNVIDRETWERFVRFNDVEPSTIPRLGEIIYNTYTRVDVRRMARVGILDDQQLLQAYADLGFFAQTAENAEGKLRAIFVPNPDFSVDKAQALVLFTKVFNALPELRRRFANGWIGEDAVLAGILETGVSAERAEKIFQTIVKEAKPDRVAKEKELTRALITRAWKLRLINFAQGTFLLQRLGWGVPEAELILRVVSEFDDVPTASPTSLGARLGAVPIGTIPFDGEELEG